MFGKFKTSKTAKTLRTRVPVCVLCDTSASVLNVGDCLTQSVRECIIELKTHPQLMGKDIIFTLIPYSGDIKKESMIISKPVSDIQPSEIELNYSGSTNPAAALKLAKEVVIDQYYEWIRDGIESTIPVIINFSDGNPYPANPCQTDYENIAKEYEELDTKNEIIICSAAFGDANIDNLRLVTSHKERVLDITNKDINKLVKFFRTVIPKTVVHSVTNNLNQIDKLFEQLNS